MKRYAWIRWLACVILAIGLLALWLPQITDAPIENDARESMGMAVNLARHGVMSLDDAPPYRPTNFREPVPVIVSAIGVKLLDLTLGAAEPQQLIDFDRPFEVPSDDLNTRLPHCHLQAPRIKYLKYQNILWLGLLSFGAYWAVRTLSGSFWWGLIGAAVINEPLLPHEFSPIDNLLTELPATALLVLASTAMALAYQRQKGSLFLLAGLLFGILALIKAVVYYVFFGLVASLIGVYLLRRPALPWPTALRALLVLVIAFAGVVAPWQYRNHVELGTLQITQRGGLNLWERAQEDQISTHEYLGAFYVWAREGRIQDWLGNTLHFVPADVQRGGSLQRLNSEFESPVSAADLPAVDAGLPDRTVTLFRRAEAERTRLARQYAAAGRPHPDIAAERDMFAQAARLIAAHPWRHAALTLPFAWRGAAQTLPLLLIGLCFGIGRRRYDVVLFLLPAFGIVLVYALFTPYFPRFGWPPHLIALLTLVILIPLIRDAIYPALPRSTR